MHGRALACLAAGTVGLLLVTACTAPAAPETGAGNVTVADAWARPAAGAMSGGEMGGGANGAVYLTLRNDGNAPDRLVRAEGTVAAAIELHTVEEKDGVMSMRPVDGIDVPAGGEVKLEPGGFHVMLIGLTEDLTPGGTVELTLHFENAGAVPMTAEVRSQ